MAFEPNMTRRKNLLTLRDFVTKQPHGSRVSWVEVEQQTGVAMSGQLNRNLFRAACRREKRGYIPLRGGGVEFSSAANARECVERYNTLACGVVRAAAEKTAYVTTRHLHEMDGEERKELLRVASIASMLSMVARAKRAPELPAAEPVARKRKSA